MDAQSVKTVEGSAHTSGFAAHKRVKGRKRRLLVDALGITLFYCVTPADLHDTQGARRLLAGLRYFVPRLKTIWADSAYRGKDLAEWCKALGNWDIAVVDRTPARADSPFTGALIDWVARQYWITLDVVYPALRQLKRYSPDLLPDLGYEPGGFQVIPKRWIVERTFSWLGRQRRLSKDYERLPSTAEAFIYLVGIRLLLARLTRR